MFDKHAPEHEHLTVTEICRYLNISQTTAYELVHRKDFPVCRFGGKLRIPRIPFLNSVVQKVCIPNGLASVA